MSKASERGARAERDAVVLLLAAGFRNAERHNRAGARYDVGDVRGIPRTTIEVKDQEKLDFSGWLAEAEAERINAGNDYAILIAKRRGKHLKDGYFVMRVEDGIRLLHEALTSDKTLRNQLRELLNE